MASETEHQIDELIGVRRRSLLKALSAGAGLAVGGAGVAAGRGSDSGGGDDPGDDAAGADDDHDESDGDQRGSREIDPHYGFASPDGEEPPAEIQPDHTVDLLVRFPEPPEGGSEGENGDASGEGNGDESNGDETEAGDDDSGMSQPEFDHPPFFFFEPVGLHVSSGDVVQFRFTTPDHTVTAYHAGNGLPQRVPEGVPPFSSPVVNVGGYWLYQFDEPGVYDVYCGPHHFFGMVMRIVVGDLGEEELPGYATSPQPEQGPPSSEDIAGLLNAFRDGTCEWPLLAPGEIFESTPLGPMAIQESGSVPFADVAADLGYELEDADDPADDEGANGDAEATVRIHEHAEHGAIMAGPDEMTLYMFDQDEQGASESACYDGCAENWPPLTVEGTPTPGDGVDAELTTFEREDGSSQVAANGWPLYYFAGDEAPGDANGQGANDVWWVLGPDGTPLRSESEE